MNFKPIILGIQVVTLGLIFSFMKKYGVSRNELIAAGIICISIVLNGYMFWADYRVKRWKKRREEKQKLNKD